MARLTRRQALKALGASSGGLLLLGTIDSASAAASEQAGQRWLVGTVQLLRYPTALEISSTQGTVEVMVSATTSLAHPMSNGRAQLSDFVIGEDIAAYGSQTGGAFDASILTSLFRAAQGRVAEVTTDHLILSTGLRLRLNSSTLFRGGQRRSVADLRVGDSVQATVWRNPTSSDRVAVLLTGQA